MTLACSRFGLWSSGASLVRGGFRMVHGLGAGVAVTLVGLCLAMAGTARAAVVHDFLSGPTEAISREARTCSGPGTLTTPLTSVDALAVDAGKVWVGERYEGEVLPTSKERVDAFNDSTGSCARSETGVGQLEDASSLQGPGFGGIAVGHHTGEREVYVGSVALKGLHVSEYKEAVVGVFGEAGTLQHVWTGADTPSGSFRKGGFTGEATVRGVAVDESAAANWARGDVLVVAGTGENHGGVVDVLAPGTAGEEPPAAGIWQLRGTCPSVGMVCSGAEVIPFSNPERVAVDQENGELFVVDSRSNESTQVPEDFVDVFAPEGLAGEYKYLGRLTPPGGAAFFTGVMALAVDGAPGYEDVYVGSPSEVQEFDFSTGILTAAFVGKLTGSGSGSPFSDVKAVAIDPATNDVYVGENRPEEVGAVDVFGPNLIVPDVQSTSATEVSASTAKLHGTVNPDGAGEVSCVFEYGTSAAYGQQAPCTKKVANGSTAVAAESPLLENLASGTTYHYRVSATNQNGTNTGVCPEDCGEFETKGPSLGAASALAVTATSAKLTATIDPDGLATSYFFEYGREYGRTGSYEARAPAYPGKSLGAGREAIDLPDVNVQDLAASTEYHYRVVAVSEAEVSPGKVEVHEFMGEDRTFTTQGSASTLPDGRDWEMVSPPVKEGALLEPIDAASGTNGTVIQAAAGGDAFAYLASTPTEASPVGNANTTELFSTRTPDGWETKSLDVPHAAETGQAVGVGSEYRFFSEDLSLGILQPFGAFDSAISPEASESTPFVRSDFVDGSSSEQCTSDCLRPLVTSQNTPPGTRFGELGDKTGVYQEEGEACPPAIICGPQFVGATPDDQHVVLTSSVALTKTAIPEELHEPSLYEWDSPTGTLALVSLLPEGEGEKPVAGAVLGDENADARGAVSDDGSRVFWSAVGGLYMSEMAGGEQPTKVLRLDVPAHGCETCTGEPNARFQIASGDGSRVWFTDTQRLTADAGAKTGDPDLYECRIVEDACELSDLTPKGAGGENAYVQGGVLGASEDGAWVYFVADGALTAEAVHGDCKENNTATDASASCNLYVRHEGITKLVAVLSGEDLPDWGQENGGEALEGMTARVSPNGEWLAFMSDRQLTGYDTRDAQSGHSDEEVYLYDAATEKVICASCDPTGARPIGEEYAAGNDLPLVGGNRIWNQSSWLAALVPGWTPFRLGMARHQSRYLSDSGRLFFDARDPLVPQAHESWNVYEWEPVGVPAESSYECSSTSTAYSAASGGCVGLISSGESPNESAFLEASESGGDVFFLTTSRLSSADYDNSYDVYDAHECTGASPCPPPVPEQAEPCRSAANCRAAPAPQPEVFGAPASATFSGPGNPTATSTPSSPRHKTASPPLTRVEKLKRALAVCRGDRSRLERERCEAAARHRYGPAPAKRRGRGAKATAERARRRS